MLSNVETRQLTQAITEGLELEMQRIAAMYLVRHFDELIRLGINPLYLLPTITFYETKEKASEENKKAQGQKA